MYRDGIIAGCLGAASVALWFFVVDLINGQPLFTPSVLGTGLFRVAVHADAWHPVLVSFLVVSMLTVLHVAVFAGVGVVVAILLPFFDPHPGIAFGLLLVFVLAGGFNVAAMLLAEPILRALWWPSIVAANLLAAIAMGGYFWVRRRRHPGGAPTTR